MKRKGEEMFKKVLVPLDGSSLAEQILPYAEEIARRWESRLVLLRVVLPVKPIIGIGEFVPSASYIATRAEDERREMEEAQRYLEAKANSIRQKGLLVDCVTVRGQPGEEIIRYAKEKAVEMIAISTHGRSGLGRLAFGSVADQVLRESGLPVLLIRPRTPKA